MELNRTEQMLFALLRASLHEQDTETACFQEATGDDWTQCYKLASQHGVMALAWEGVLRLPSKLQPPRILKLTWGMAVEQYENRYLHYCQTVDRLSDFYAEHGITTVQLKGVGFSTLYPVPSHREGGDIDIYTFSADKGKMSDSEANQRADALMEEQDIDVDTAHAKHSVFHYHGISIENHKTFLNVTQFRLAQQVEQILKANLNPQTTLLAQGKVLIPSPLFNTLFIAFHAAQHYGSGLALHHLCDWAILLRRYGCQLPDEIQDTPFFHWIEALTTLCNHHLGMSISIKENKKHAEEILEEMLHPRYVITLPTRNPWSILVYKTRRLLHRHQLQSKYLPSSLVGTLWKSLVSHLCHPQTLFR